MTGVASLESDVRQGDTGAIIVDVVGIALDATALLLPSIPGGASFIIKGIRVAEE